jgi:hypothetical protein
VDAKGRIWTSCGSLNRTGANASDCYGDSYVSFDGWHTITFPLPGQYAGKDQYVCWPRRFEWWPTNTPEAKAAAAKAASTPAVGPIAKPAAPAANEPEAAPDDMAADVDAPSAAPAKDASQSGAEVPVDYPVKLTKIIVTMRPSLLYVDGQRQVANRVIYLDRLGVIPAPEDK